MIFRKDSFLFYQGVIMYIVVAILCLALIPVLGLSLSLILIIPFVVLIFANTGLHNEYIVMDEKGISCYKSGKDLWGYRWNSVAELRKSNRFLMPSIEVIVYNKCGAPEPFAHPNEYFQLSRSAKKAIKQYYNQQS